MPAIRETKTECSFRFYTDNDYDSLTCYYPGVLHLFEHAYDHHTLFWYGVAEIACTSEQYDEAMRRGEPPDFSIQVKLPDGRIGAARQLTAKMAGGDDHEFVQSSIIGFTGLEIPRVGGSPFQSW